MKSISVIAFFVDVIIAMTVSVSSLIWLRSEYSHYLLLSEKISSCIKSVYLTFLKKTGLEIHKTFRSSISTVFHSLGFTDNGMIKDVEPDKHDQLSEIHKSDSSIYLISAWMVGYGCDMSRVANSLKKVR